MRERRASYGTPGYIEEIIYTGTQRVREETKKTLFEMQKRWDLLVYGIGYAVKPKNTSRWSKNNDETCSGLLMWGPARPLYNKGGEPCRRETGKLPREETC
jgi:hypothetical protein